MPDKLTDKEIVKALEICGTYKVDRSNCKQVLLGAIEIINRLQAENERLKKDNEYCLEDYIIKSNAIHKKALKTAKAEAYKEFVNKIKVHAYYIDFPKEHRVVDEDDIDNLLKELVGEDNG